MVPSEESFPHVSAEVLPAASIGRRWDRTWSRVERLLELWSEAVQEHPRAFLSVFSVVFLVGTAARAWVRPLWYDELLALAVASQPTVERIWVALAAGVDLHPPLHHLLSHAAYTVTGVGPWGLRLPALIGFWVMSLCLFSFIARRTGPLYGAVALLIPVSTSAFEFATQGRPYGLMLGCAAVALLGWQSATERPRRALSLAVLTLGLAGAISTTYHAAFVFLPIIAGEAARSWSMRRLDWPVWFSIGAGGLPLLGFLSLIRNPLGYLHPHGAGWEKLIDIYVTLPGPVLIPLAGTAILLTFFQLAQIRINRDRRSPRAGHSAHELVAIIGFMLVPLASFTLATIGGMGSFFWVYVLPTVIGMSLLPATLLFRWADHGKIVAAAFVFVALSWFSIRQVSPVWSALNRSRVETVTPTLLQEGIDDGRPVVIADPILFLQLLHYESPNLKSRLHFVTDLDYLARATGQDGTEHGLLDLNKIQPIPLSQYSDFIRMHREFYLYWTGKRFEWLASRLKEDGARLEVLRAEPGQSLFLVTVPSISPAASVSNADRTTFNR